MMRLEPEFRGRRLLFGLGGLRSETLSCQLGSEALVLGLAALGADDADNLADEQKHDEDNDHRELVANFSGRERHQRLNDGQDQRKGWPA